MRSNIVELEIEELLPNGEGLSSIDTKPIQVRNALPGESVSARILKKSKGKLHCGCKLLLLSPVSSSIIELWSPYLQLVLTYIQAIQK